MSWPGYPTCTCCGPERSMGVTRIVDRFMTWPIPIQQDPELRQAGLSCALRHSVHWRSPCSSHSTTPTPSLPTRRATCSPTRPTASASTPPTQSQTPPPTPSSPPSTPLPLVPHPSSPSRLRRTPLTRSSTQTMSRLLIGRTSCGQAVTGRATCATYRKTTRVSECK